MKKVIPFILLAICLSANALDGIIYKASPPTLIDGQEQRLLGDSSGNLKVSGTLSTTPPSNASANVTQFGSNNVVTGTGVGGNGIPRVTVSSDSFPATQAATQSGTWTIQPGNTANTTAWKVDGSAATQPISAVSLPLPTGAATLAKQPALGIAGTASVDVISVQGIASMTALKVDGSGVTQPSNITAASSGGWTYVHISTSTDTVVKGGAGRLHAISINTDGTVASSTTIYDNTTCTGTVVAVINSLAVSGSFLFDANMTTGICVTTTGTAAPDVTVLYN